MELQVTQENLNKALQAVARVATGKSTLPILSNVLLQIADNRLTISATNLDIAIKVYIGAKVTKQGSLTVPARLMQDFVNNLPQGTIDIEQQENKLHITAGGFDSTINGVPADEFPVMPAISDGSAWEVDSQTFKDSLSRVVFAASADEARPVLTGVYLLSKKENLYAAATDSYRLAEGKIGQASSQTELLIPASAIQDLLRIIGDDQGKVSVECDEQQVQFTVAGIELVARLIDGKYPDYQKLLPKSFEVQASLANKELANIAKVSSLFAKESAGSITVEVSEKNQTLSIRSVASQVGENVSEASATVKGSGEITLNSRYLLDALSAAGGEDVEFCFNGKLDPIVVRNPQDKDYTHIIMPLKS